MEENPLQVQNPVSEGSPSPVQPGPKPLLSGIKILVLLIALLLLAGGVGAYFYFGGNGSSREGQKSQDEVESAVKGLGQNSIVYGYWKDTYSYINSYDLSTTTNTVLAILPTNVKHVKVLGPTKIMYINNTNERDYGDSLVVRTLNDQKDTIVFSADQNYGIDDYIVSSDGNYAAVWQLSPPPDTIALKGGRSRVTSIAVNDLSEKHTIYDESTLSPVHYPVAVSSNGDVYMDKFLPNADAGWAYGMSFSNFTGTVKNDIAIMQSGSYSTQPIMSPDGKYLVFSGYDGSNGPGTDSVDGFRRGISNPNTVELFDLSRNERTVIASSSSGIYPAAYWDAVSGNPIYTYISKESDQSGAFIFDLQRSLATRLEALGVQSTLIGGQHLVADKTSDLAALGNLGGKYAQSLTAFYIEELGKERVKIDTAGSYLQLIGVTSSNYFPTNINAIDPSKTEEKGRQLSLQTLDIKPSLAPQRLEQQSGERCRDVAAAQCNALLGTNFTGEQARNAIKTSYSTGNQEFDQCARDQWEANQAERTCTDSPLYLYGPEGLVVNLRADTTLYSVNVPYEQMGFRITLGSNGKFTANGNIVDSIEYDYEPALKLSRPAKGVVVAKEDLASTMRSISENLGLNEKETSDTVKYAVSKITAPFAYISFYDEATSRKILPLYFDPIPDTYRNIVFYLEGLEENVASYDMPKLEKFERHGFTAVEISFIVR